MNERCLRYHLLNEGYDEDEIEDRAAEIAEDMNDRARDDELMESSDE